MPRALRSVDLHYYSRNKAELKVLLGREPDGGVSPEQALALLEHLRWLDGLMPSERIRLEQAVRREHKLEVFAGFVAKRGGRTAKGGNGRPGKRPSGTSYVSKS